CPGVSRVEQRPELGGQLVGRSPILQNLRHDLSVRYQIDQAHPLHRSQPLKNFPAELMHLVSNYHWCSRQSRLERRGSRLHQRGIGRGQQGCGVFSNDFETIGIRIDTVRGAGYEHPVTTSFLEQLVGRIPKRLPQSPDLLAPAPWEDRESPAGFWDAQTGPSLAAAWPRRAVDQRVTDVIASETKAVEKLLFERQHDCETVHCRRKPAGSFRSPGPELRSDVVQDLGTRAMGRFSHPEMESGIVHQDGQIVSAHPEVSLQSAQQAIMG